MTETTVCRGGGHDRFFVGEGADLLMGESGEDRLEGGAGDDRLQDGYGVDVLLGGDRNDLMMGDLGTDASDPLPFGPSRRADDLLAGGADQTERVETAMCDEWLLVHR